MPGSRRLFCERALLADGWADGVSVDVDANGIITAVTSGHTSPPPGAETLRGFVVPGIPNCHSHAFQLAMAGLAERRGSPDDSFWSWREAMYRLLQQIGPDELEAIAGQLYIEMLKHGYTSVAEFHYLHHDRDGKHYDDPAEMSLRVIAAARVAGIHVTHLPVLYCHSDFGALPPEPGQRRFVHTADTYHALLQRLHAVCRGERNLRLGAAPHSLRAASEPVLRAAVAALDDLDSTAPLHIHIAEQQREVAGSLACYGARPVEWLLDRFDVGSRWCLVHATHIDDAECRRLADSGAVAGLCPTTEANLGDGIFPAADYLGAAGRMAVGSDSQVSLDPAQELRLLEYGQRLSRLRRAVLASPSQPSVGEFLLRRCLAGGALALGINTGVIATGCRADIAVLDDCHPGLYGKSGSAVLDSWIFSCNGTPVRDVMVAGQWRVRGGAHPDEEAAARRFREVMVRLGQWV